MVRESGLSRKSAEVVAHETGGDVVLDARIEDHQDLVAGLDDGVRLGHETRAAAQYGDHERALRQPDLLDRLAGGGRVVGDHELDDLQPLLGQVEQVHEAVARHLVLDQAQDEVRRADRGLDAEQLEVVEVAGVVDAGDDPLAEVLLLGHLADEEVVLVVARDRDHEVGALDPRALEHPQLGGVAVLDRVLELLLDGQVAAAVLLDHRHLVALVDELASEVPADLAGAGHDHVQAGHQLPNAAVVSCSIAICVGQIVRTPCSLYQAARRGSSTRATTRATPKRRWATWAITRLVLSPLVEAMKTSARSTPASISASSSMAVPIV